MKYEEIMVEAMKAAQGKIPYTETYTKAIYWAWVTDQLNADLKDYIGVSHWRR